MPKNNTQVKEYLNKRIQEEKKVLQHYKDEEQACLANLNRVAGAIISKRQDIHSLENQVLNLEKHGDPFYKEPEKDGKKTPPSKKAPRKKPATKIQPKDK